MRQAPAVAVAYGEAALFEFEQGIAVEAQQDGVGRGGRAMLDGEQQAPVAAARQIAGGVGPGVQVRGAAQGLAEVAPRALGEVMDQDESHLMAAIELAQNARQSGDVGG